MNAAAFALIAALLAGYALLDGYDLGAGTLHLLFGRSDERRAQTFEAIGPFWNGNEVMLVAAGAVLFALFPRVYAASFSGFYLPFMIVLWLLMVRGMSIELRGHFPSDMWRGFWDVAFCLSSALLSFLFGVAFGNVLRGVPLDPNGYFTGTFGGLLNTYAVGTGLLAVASLALHGAAFVWWRGGDGAVWVRRLPAPVAVLFVVMTWATASSHPSLHEPILWIAPAVAAASLVAAALTRDARIAFAATSIFLLALIGAAAETVFPFLLPAFPFGSGGLSAYNSAPSQYSLSTGFAAFAAGLGATVVYATLAARRLLRAKAL